MTAQWRVCMVALVLAMSVAASAQEKPTPSSKVSPEAKTPAADPTAPSKTPLGDLVPLNPERTILLDKPGKRLVLKTQVVFRDGLLEMLCCLKQTKEHESIVSLDGQAYQVHAGLLALGARPGTPVSYTPDYKPATGQTVAIYLSWTDKAGKTHRVSAQSWIRTSTRRFLSETMKALPDGLELPEDSALRYDDFYHELLWFGPMSVAERDELLKLSEDEGFRRAIGNFYTQSQPRQMDARWVFAGSGFYKDEETGREYYQAESGDLICVANFPTALLDLAIESSAQNEALLYEAYTERIPPLGTEVLMELIPLPAEAAKAAGTAPSP